ncbi:hypothetical protein Hanom_Chr03g00202391 [Helianthus anomalus]
MALEDFFRKINLLHKMLNMLVMPPMEPIWPQEVCNLAKEVIHSTGWDEIPLEPPINATLEVPINPAPLPQEEVDEEPFIFLPREIEECSTTSKRAFSRNSLKTFEDWSRFSLVIDLSKE